MDQSLMDELFERIKILEQENKLLETEYNNLDNELLKKKAEISAKQFMILTYKALKMLNKNKEELKKKKKKKKKKKRKKKLKWLLLYLIKGNYIFKILF